MTTNIYNRYLSKYACQRIENLHNSKSWKKSNWSRKIKLANKEFQRICQIEKYSTISNHKEARTVSLYLLSPLRIVPSNWYGCNPSQVLLFLNNKIGTRLTKIAIKKGGWIFMVDVISYRDNQIPLSFVEVRYGGLAFHPVCFVLENSSLHKREIDPKWIAYWMTRYEEGKMSPKAYNEMTNFVLLAKKAYGKK